MRLPLLNSILTAILACAAPLGCLLLWVTAQGMTAQLDDAPQRPTASSATAPSSPTGDSPQPAQPVRQLEDVLAAKVDLQIEAASLQEVLKQLEKIVRARFPQQDERFEIQLLGNDLKSEGITRNQRISKLRMKQKSVAAILTAIVRQANPNRAARSASDDRQVLIWTTGPATADAKQHAVLITTRRAVKAKGWTLPPVFQATPATDNTPATSVNDQPWSDYVTAETLEDEVKRIAPALAEELTTVRKFSRGGYRRCREHFTVLSALFAVISQYDQPVRWQKQAAGLARFFGRQADVCKVSTDPAYRSAKVGQEILADLVGGEDAALPARVALGPIKQWNDVCDRGPLMMRMNHGLEKTLMRQLENQQAFVAGQEALVREAELIAIISLVIRQNKMEDADDQGYADHARRLTAAARSMSAAARKNDLAGAATALNLTKTACSKCHEEYR